MRPQPGAAMASRGLLRWGGGGVRNRLGTRVCALGARKGRGFVPRCAGPGEGLDVDSTHRHRGDTGSAEKPGARLDEVAASVARPTPSHRTEPCHDCRRYRRADCTQRPRTRCPPRPDLSDPLTPSTWAFSGTQGHSASWVGTCAIAGVLCGSAAPARRASGWVPRDVVAQRAGTSRCRAAAGRARGGRCTAA